jgi:hypothetical protein
MRFKRGCLLLSLLLAAPPVAGLAGDVDLRPEARGSLPGLVLHKINGGRSMAHRHLSRYPSCSGLFQELNADGGAILALSRFEMASARDERRWCDRGAVMLTHVGGGVVRICGGGLERLGRGDVTALLLHEALHHAGLTESPADPQAEIPREITRRVRQSCRL